ncbi:hypothetical protein B0T10DRAFT_66317 [Thelonectria olida]|uniref:Uncharacterized protein n=1 Tax=Thelonectria olida TaxID=1576542 RepID=A0A9P9AL19_9HYPO|nr:hypothetical protein B0T10DRAFT_66317 [Thelonectria olida]
MSIRASARSAARSASQPQNPRVPAALRPFKHENSLPHHAQRSLGTARSLGGQQTAGKGNESTGHRGSYVGRVLRLTTKYLSALLCVHALVSPGVLLSCLVSSQAPTALNKGTDTPRGLEDSGREDRQLPKDGYMLRIPKGIHIGSRLPRRPAEEAPYFEALLPDRISSSVEQGETRQSQAKQGKAKQADALCSAVRCKVATDLQATNSSSNLRTDLIQIAVCTVRTIRRDGAHLSEMTLLAHHETKA